MNTIKNNLIRDFTDKNLSLLFFYYHQMNPIEVMYFWNNILKILDESNLLQVLGFILDLQDTSLVFPRYAQKSLNFHIHQVNKKIAKLLPKDLAFYMKNLKLFKFAKESKSIEIKEKKFDGDFFLINHLYDLLVRTPTVEINNSIENYFNMGIIENLDIDITKKLLNNIKKINSEYRITYIKYICSILTSPKDIIEYIYYNMVEEDSAILIETLYLHNKPLYNDIVKEIYENRKYYRIEIIKMLLEINLKKLDLKDENIEIIKYLLVNKPIFVDDLYEVLNNKISKKHLLGLFVDNFEILKNFKFNLNFDDLITISLEKPEILYEIYKLPLEDDQKNTIYNIFKSLDEDFIVDFLKIHEDLDLISFILTNRQLKHSLKNFIVENYRTQSQFLYKLFIYFEKSEVQSYINELLVDKKSLEYFLLVLKPTDILVHALELSDVSRGIKILDFCFNSPSFNENDFIFALNIIENSMPPLIIRTLIITLKKYPHLKNFTVSYLFKIINKNALYDKKLKTGIIKCLELLGQSAVDIIASLSEERMEVILDDSTFLKDLCYGTVYRHEFRYKRDYNILKKLLREKYNKH